MLTIGQVAKAANVNVETIRYYQRRGLLHEPVKPLGGHRRYSNEDVDRLQFIKRAQMLGFTLEEIENLLRLGQAIRCAETHDLAAHKLTLIDSKIADLLKIREALSGLVSQCEAGNGEGDCPIIRSLAQGRT
jgi:MerR family transcriptional regulator, mercuric resistance operon regulatory protein